MPRVGVVLSGSGYLDGSEIHEATLTLFFLDKVGAEIVCMAPHGNQYDVVDHLSAKVTSEKRDTLVEAARIARSAIKDIKDVKGNDIDAVIFPGGYGAAKNLSDFAVAGVEFEVCPEVKRLITELYAAKRPMGFICIAPIIAAKVLGEHNPTVTIGNDPSTADAVTKMGGTHVVRRVDEIEVDEKNRLVSTPAYMLGPTIAKVAIGIEKLVLKIIELV